MCGGICGSSVAVALAAVVVVVVVAVMPVVMVAIAAAVVPRDDFHSRCNRKIFLGDYGSSTAGQVGSGLANGTHV